MVMVSPRSQQRKKLLLLPLYGNNNRRTPSPVTRRRSSSSKGIVDASFLLQVTMLFFLGGIVLFGVNLLLTPNNNNNNNKASASASSSVEFENSSSSEWEEEHPLKNYIKEESSSTSTQSQLKYRVRQDYIQHLQGLSINQAHPMEGKRIPKIVHVIFPNATKLPSDIQNYSMLQHNIIGSMFGDSRLNINWNLRLYDDHAIRKIIKDAYEVDGLISQEEYSLLENAHIAELSDIARYVLLYKYGGLYINVDRIVNVKLDSIFDQLLDDDHEVPAKLFIPTTNDDMDFAQDMIASVPQNKLFKILLEKTMLSSYDERLHHHGGNGRPNNNGQIMKLGGPQLFTEVVSNVVFEKVGDPEDSNLDGVVNEARSILLEGTTKGLIRSGLDEPSLCNGPLVTNFDGCQHVTKTDFYQAYGIL